MPKNVRAHAWKSEKDQHINKKQKCHPDICIQNNDNRSVIEPSESVLLPETEDSFFTDTKLDRLLDSHGKAKLQKKNQFYDDNTDDDLFTDIELPHGTQSSGENVGATPMTQILPNTNGDILGDESLFSEINLDDLVDSEKPQTYVEIYQENVATAQSGKTVFTSSQSDNDELFKDDFLMEELVQGTQKFLNDVAFKLPQTPAFNETQTILKLSIDACIQGTQYETRTEIHNRTVNPLRQTNVAEDQTSLLKNLSHINWETQIIEPEITEDYPCKEDFYGLPDKVKNMIFEHKGIQSLYGKFIQNKFTKCVEKNS